MLAAQMLRAQDQIRAGGPYEFPHVEFAALVYWSQSQDSTTAAVPEPKAVEEVRTALARLFFTTERYYMTEEQRAVAVKDRAAIAHMLRSTGLGIRVPAYEVHQKHILHGIFDPFDGELQATLGFTVTDVIACFDAINVLMGYASHQWHAAAADSGIDAALRVADAYLAFDAAEVAREASVAEATANAVLAAFSLTRGSPEIYVREPSPFTVLRDRPILAVGDGHFLVPNIALLIPAIQPRLESLLNPTVTATAGAGLWNRYERARGKWVEEESLRLLQRMMPGGNGIVSAYYEVGGFLVEGDIVYQVDDVVFLVEDKAGMFAAGTWRGGKDLENDFEDIVTKGHDQALRTRDYILAGNQVFMRSDGTEAFRLTGTIREIIPIVITLDTVGVFGCTAAAMSRHGFMNGDPSWVVWFTDFLLLSEVLSRPGELRHYARERYRTLLFEHVLTFDETDYLGMYLEHNETTLMEGEADTIMLSGYTDALDNHYAFRKSQSPPAQEMPPELERVVAALARYNRPLWTEAVCDLFRLDGTTRKKMAKEIRQRMRPCRIDRRFFTLQGKFGYTIVMQTGVNPSALLSAFISDVQEHARGFHSKALYIAYDPDASIARAEYWEQISDGQYFRVPPAIAWTSPITKR